MPQVRQYCIQLGKPRQAAVSTTVNWDVDHAAVYSCKHKWLRDRCRRWVRASQGQRDVSRGVCDEAESRREGVPQIENSNCQQRKPARRDERIEGLEVMSNGGEEFQQCISGTSILRLCLR